MRDALGATLGRAGFVRVGVQAHAGHLGGILLRAREIAVEFFQLALHLLLVSLVVAQRPGGPRGRGTVRGLHGGERIGRARGHGRVMRHDERREGHDESACACVRGEGARGGP